MTVTDAAERPADDEPTAGPETATDAHGGGGHDRGDDGGGHDSGDGGEVFERGGSHVARNAAIAVGVVLVLFIVLLATRTPPEQRLGPNPMIGRAAPRVAGVTLDGSTVDIDKFRGKWVVVNFFATWCVPCRIEHPELVAFSEKHDELRDAVVVSVQFSDNEAALREFFEQQGGTWPVLVGDTGPIAVDWGITGVPESFVVDPDGRVVAHFEGVTAAALDDIVARVRILGSTTTTPAVAPSGTTPSGGGS